MLFYFRSSYCYGQDLRAAIMQMNVNGMQMSKKCSVNFGCGAVGIPLNQCENSFHWFHCLFSKLPLVTAANFQVDSRAGFQVDFHHQSNSQALNFLELWTDLALRAV